MPTPNFVFRLPTVERAALIEMAKLYGAPNTSAFLREMVGAMCSGDTDRVKAFNLRLFSKVGEQLALKLNATMDGLTPEPRVKREVRKARTKPTARKKRRPRDRTA